jgi:hypothetical protein
VRFHRCGACSERNDTVDQHVLHLGMAVGSSLISSADGLSDMIQGIEMHFLLELRSRGSFA